MGPIEACQHFDVFNDELIQRMRTYYDSIGTYRSPVMNKADPGKALEWIEPTLRSYYPQLGKFLGGNFYKHKTPYHPHVDHQPDWPLSVNFVVPIFVEGPPVDFVVFDQRWHMKPITWAMVQKVNEFFRNGFSITRPENGIPGSTEIEGHTQKHIDHDFWARHLDHPYEYYFGLSGKAFPFIPGSLIMFETKHIHCTGRFNGLKLGLTLRYSIKQEEA